MNPEENNLNTVPTPIQSTPTPQEPLAQPAPQDSNVPQEPAAQAPVDVKVPSRIGLAIISFILFWPLGIAALINSSRVKKCLASGDVTGAQEASAKVKKIGVWAFGVTAFITIGFLAIFGIIRTATNAATAAPSKASEQFLSYIADGNADSAYSLTSPAFKEVVPESEFASFVSVYEVIDFESAKVKSKEVSTNDTDGNLAEIGYEASSTAQEFTITTYLVKSGENWLIQNISVTPKE